MTPPRFAVRLMRWSLSPEDRPAVLGDLDEEFDAIANARSVADARRWYWRQALTSAAPNAMRRVRQAYLREYGTPEALRAQRKSRRFGFRLLALGAGMMVVSVPLHLSLANGGAVAAWGLLLLAFSYLETGRPRRPKPGEGMVAFALIVTWLGALIVSRASEYLAPMGFIAFWVVINLWPRALWPVPIRRPPARYSVLTPIVHFRQADGSLYSTSTLPADPMAMDRPTLGLAEPMALPAEDSLEGMVPLAPVLRRSFRADESIRLFSVINADPDRLDATLEVRAQATGYVVRRVRISVTEATPKLPPPPPPWRDDDVVRLPQWPVSALDVVLPLGGLAAGKYDLRLVATEGTVTSSEDDEIVVLPDEARQSPASRP